MSLTAFVIFLCLALGIITASLWFIRHQLKLNQTRQERLLAGEARYLEERQKRLDSISVLLRVANTDEMNWIEASIRIKNLLDQLGIDLSDHDDISAFYIVTERTEHIPTHEQWGSLPKEAKAKFRREMEKCEADNVDHLLRAQLSLSNYSFSE